MLAPSSGITEQTMYIVVGVCAGLLVCCCLIIVVFFYKRVYEPKNQRYRFREYPLNASLHERGIRSGPVGGVMRPPNPVLLRHGSGGPQTEMIDGDSPGIGDGLSHDNYYCEMKRLRFHREGTRIVHKIMHVKQVHMASAYRKRVRLTAEGFISFE